MAVAFLAHIQAGHADAKGADAADEVQKSAVGHRLKNTQGESPLTLLEPPYMCAFTAAASSPLSTKER